MTINYDALLTGEQKQNILQQRISQMAAEAWQLEINKKALQKTGDTQSLEMCDKSISSIETAITVFQEELEKLKQGA